MLKKLKSEGYKLGIFSSNSTDNVTKFLKIHGLDFFDHITTYPRIWKKHKGLKKFMKRNFFKPNQIIYIGDETRDAVAARKAKIKFAAVTLPWPPRP